ncbi:MAG TPA: hypothetical protein PK691_06745 [Thermomicrobiales bacterium]|nr:hypothetical protein [Thermomicrobiales bacterium]HRA46872.1 hypothetical protein [Thermomicrobiales bacterium]
MSERPISRLSEIGRFGLIATSLVGTLVLGGGSVLAQDATPEATASGPCVALSGITAPATPEAMMEASPEATPEVTGETADEATTSMATAALQNAINCESDPEALQTLFTPGFVMAAGGYDSIEAAAADGFFGNSPLADAEVGSVTSYSDGTVGINIQYFATQYQVVSDKWVLADVDGEWKFDGIRDGDPANVDGDQAAVGVNLLENGDGTYAIAANKESVVATDVLILQAINVATNLEGHELVVVQLPEGADPAGIIDGSITEDDVTFIGQVTVAAPGDSTDMTLVGLPAGQYTLLCAFSGPDGKPHFMNGMIAPFEVTAAT